MERSKGSSKYNVGEKHTLPCFSNGGVRSKCIVPTKLVESIYNLVNVSLLCLNIIIFISILALLTPCTTTNQPASSPPGVLRRYPGTRPASSSTILYLSRLCLEDSEARGRKNLNGLDQALLSGPSPFGRSLTSHILITSS